MIRDRRPLWQIAATPGGPHYWHPLDWPRCMPAFLRQSWWTLRRLLSWRRDVARALRRAGR